MKLLPHKPAVFIVGEVGNVYNSAPVFQGIHGEQTQGQGAVSGQRHLPLPAVGIIPEVIPAPQDVGKILDSMEEDNPQLRPFLQLNAKVVEAVPPVPDEAGDLAGSRGQFRRAPRRLPKQFGLSGEAGTLEDAYPLAGPEIFPELSERIPLLPCDRYSL